MFSHTEYRKDYSRSFDLHARCFVSIQIPSDISKGAKI